MTRRKPPLPDIRGTVVTEHQGMKHEGTYTMTRGKDPKLTVSSSGRYGGSKSRDLRGLPAEVVARMLLHELVIDGLRMHMEHEKANRQS
jgi:hypothetical protein